MPSRACTKCGRRKPRTEYYPHSNRRGLRPDCKDCVRTRSQGSRSPTEEQRAWALRKYGLTLEEAETYWYAEACAICGSTDSKDRRQKFHIDHCHETGQVRGALCVNCNLGLGNFQDAPDLLRAAADYLERSRMCQTA